MPEWIQPFFTTEGLVALLTLTALEIVLGIDNVVFIAVLCGKLPPEQRVKASRVGIGLAVISRILLLLTITWLIGLEKYTLFKLPLPSFLAPKSADGVVAAYHNFTAKDVVLLLGGLFLLFKATTEIHGKVTGDHLPGDPSAQKAARTATFASVIVQILLIDIVFSIDSVITAAGMSGQVPVMIAAVLISALVMVVFANPVMTFVNKNPTVKILALSFLVLIGTMLVAESCGAHIPKGYIYFAMAFSLIVEVLNMRMRARDGKHAPVPVERKPGDGNEPLV
ncbi:MAG TPA: TerC family protein [Phycisphaerales bacterium]|nr:TerC family protein [Phycisphaerales bacterium]